MKTARLSDNRDGIVAAAEILRAGGVVAVPTETVYGLAASAYDDKAIKKVFSAKGRPQDNPLIVHVSDMEMLSEVVSGIPEAAQKLAQAFWPGPLTMVLKKSGKTAESVSCGLDTIAVRMPSNNIAREIISESGLPLAAPSANISGSPSPTSAEHVLEDLDGKIDAVIISKESAVGVESTVVTLATTPPRLLRPGFVTAEELKFFLPDMEIDNAVFSEPDKEEQVASPGMKYKHYSPKTEVFLVEAGKEQFARFVNNKKNSVAIAFSEDLPDIKIKSLCYGSLSDASEQAKSIFSLLRKADKLGCESIYVHAPEKTGVGLAVYNRLVRAAGFKVIKPKYILGLTGPTGSGKTTACKVAEESGWQVIDCDKLAREAVQQEDALNALTSAFGEDIIDSKGHLDRKALAQKAFSEKEKTELLNKTILPFIVDLIKEKINCSKFEKIILDAPTLFESGADILCDKVVAILSSPENRLMRIMNRDNIDNESAVLRMNAGKSEEYYKDKTKYIINNDSGKTAFIEEFKALLKTSGGN